MCGLSKSISSSAHKIVIFIVVKVYVVGDFIVVTSALPFLVCCSQKLIFAGGVACLRHAYRGCCLTPHWSVGLIGWRTYGTRGRGGGCYAYGELRITTQWGVLGWRYGWREGMPVVCLRNA